MREARYVPLVRTFNQEEKKQFIGTPFINDSWNAKIDTLIKRIDGDKVFTMYSRKGRTLQGILGPKNEDVPAGCVYRFHIRIAVCH
ncbi:hypothetical protein ACOME3_010694, partial [Neoechinorhynchus agilis]